MKTLHGICLVATVVAICLAAAPQQKPPAMMGDELYAAYLAGGPEVLARAFPTSKRFEDFREDFRDEPFLKALDDFRSSYVLRYDLAGVPRAGWHDVAVKVTTPGRTYRIRTHTGYVGG